MNTHIRFDSTDGALHLLDQRLLPGQEAEVVCRNAQDIIAALQNMVVRGAPAIGVTAAFGCALEAAALARTKDRAWRENLDAACQAIAHARPTAVNLAWAVERMRRCWQEAENACTGNSLAPETLARILTQEALTIQAEDEALCRCLGRHGAQCLADGDTVLTHCNAGALATAGYGTALGVIRAAVAQGKRIAVIADETRPFLQGARLTAHELHKDGIPVTVACDNACALLMAQGRVQVVITGADRIAANGDSANKIGTFGVAVLARHFGIPFYIAAPLSTIDPRTPDGAAIPIEERPAREVTHLGDTQLTPQGVPVFNFAFDVTPAGFITGIITEAGILRPPYGEAIRHALAGASAHA